jgi:gamma-glutamylcyclotransferase (GGCT)/AIG2-like uncharacterized protein YtfP
MPLLYFAYGSNMHPGRLRHRLGDASVYSVARLADHRLVFHKRGADGSGKGDIVAAAGAEVWGVIYTLTADHVELLDRIEGHGYRRAEVLAHRRADGETVQAFSYRARAGFIGRGLEPFDWYLDFIVHGAAHHRLPPAYTEWLRSRPAMGDDDAARARRERALL